MEKHIKKSIKKDVKYQEIDIRKFVAEFDPLGIGEGFPEDEYDDLVYAIISILNRKDYNLECKKELLTDEVLGYADLSIMDIKKVSETVNKILFWWQNRAIEKYEQDKI